MHDKWDCLQNFHLKTIEDSSNSSSRQLGRLIIERNIVQLELIRNWRIKVWKPKASKDWPHSIWYLFCFPSSIDLWVFFPHFSTIEQTLDQNQLELISNPPQTSLPQQKSWWTSIPQQINIYANTNNLSQPSDFHFYREKISSSSETKKTISRLTEL
jgi:hypothetical protein